MSVTLDRDDETVMERFAQAGTDERTALLAWAGEHGVPVSAVSSDAALIRALLRVGAESLREQALDAGYAELAAAAETSEEHAEVRRARQRHIDHVESGPAA